MDGPKRWWGYLLLLVLLEVLGDIFLLPVLLEVLGDIFLLPVLLEALFWETIFLVEGSLLFVFLSFGSSG